MAHALGFFKTANDAVLAEAYAYEGPCYNFELVTDVLKALDNILIAGEIEAEVAEGQGRAGINPYALLFSSDLLVIFYELLTVIRSERPAAWVRPGSRSRVTPLQRVGRLLYKLQLAFGAIAEAARPGSLERITANDLHARVSEIMRYPPLDIISLIPSDVMWKRSPCR
jgi:hypothetical protein